MLEGYHEDAEKRKKKQIKIFQLIGWGFFLLTSLGLAWNRAKIEFILVSNILGWIFMLAFVEIFEKESEQ